MQNWVDENFAEHLPLLKILAAIPAPSHHEEKRAEFILNWLVRAGANDAYIDKAKNVILPFGCEGRRDITVYSAHTDVVFPDLTALPVRQEGSILYAPGVGDDTANVAAVLTCAKYVLQNGLRAREPVLLVLDSCEEGLGNLKGIRQIVHDYAGRIKEMISFDCTMGEGLVSRAVGSERWRIKASTIGGHSFGDFGRPNAIHLMAGLINRLYEQKMPDWEEQKTTYNVGTITGGTSVNTIAQDAEILYEYRSDDKMALDYMRRQFLETMEDVTGRDIRWEKELLGERPCSDDVDATAEERLLTRCENAIRIITGEPVTRRSGSTDANIPLSMGIPAVTFGLYQGGGAHTREEWLDIESLKPGLLVGLSLITSHFA